MELRPAALAALFLLVPTLAWAQSTDPDDPKAKYMRGLNTRHWGPFYVTPRILANAGWDTNVDNSQDDPFRDSAFLMSATAEVLWPIGRRARLIGTGSLTPNYFGRTESARSLDRGGGLRGEFDVGPFTLHGAVGASRAKQRFSTEIDDRLWRNEHSKGAGATAHLTRKLSLSGSWMETRSDYEEGIVVGGSDVAASLNRRQQTAGFDLGYRLTRRSALVGRAEIINDDFFGTEAAPSDQTVRSYRYLGGLSFSAIAQIQGQVLVGWRHYPTDPQEVAPSYSGPALQVNLHLPFVGDGLGLTATRDIYYAVEQAPTASGSQRNTLVASNYTGIFGFDLPLNLLARITGGLQRSDFLLPYVQEGIQYQRIDNVWSAGGSLLRRFGNRLAVGGTAVHSWRATNAEGKNYGNTRYGLTAEFSP